MHVRGFFNNDVTLPELALESSPGSVSSCLSFCTSVCVHIFALSVCVLAVLLI